MRWPLRAASTVLALALCIPLSASAGNKTRALDLPDDAASRDASGIGLSKYRAALFSAQDYSDTSGIPDLGTPNRDVTELGKLLNEQYGFDVQVVQNATEDDIIGTLDAIKAETGPEDAVIVYFAGHGLYDESENRGFWLPTDSTLTSTSRWVSNDDVAAKLRAIPARHVLVVADSCFSGMFRDTLRPSSADGSVAARSLASKRSRMVISSGSNEPVSDAGRDGMSVFAYYFRQSLAEATGRYVMPDTFFPVLRERVNQNAPQTPQQGVFNRAFHEGGQIVLVNRKVAEDPGGVADEPIGADQRSVEKACRKETSSNADGSSADEYASLGVGEGSATEQVDALGGLTADRRMRQRLAFHACMDFRNGVISQSEYDLWRGVLGGDDQAEKALADEALQELRAGAREVPPPETCDAGTAEEASLLARATALLRDGTSGAARDEDRQARTLLEQAATKKSSAALWATLARARLYAGADQGEVARAASTAASKCPEWGVPDNYLGNALVLAKDYDGALAAYADATRKSPDYAFAYYNKAAVQLASSQLEPALASLGKALQHDPLLGEAHLLRGKVLLARKDVPAAITSLESARDLRPDRSMMHEALANAYDVAGRAGEAKAARSKAAGLPD
ncbi:MAG: caspase family protein [Myxococcales bacterium]|nr:caspase family protein [Myxococcales bacterium]